MKKINNEPVHFCQHWIYILLDEKTGKYYLGIEIIGENYTSILGNSYFETKEEAREFSEKLREFDITPEENLDWRESEILMFSLCGSNETLDIAMNTKLIEIMRISLENKIIDDNKKELKLGQILWRLHNNEVHQYKVQKISIIRFISKRKEDNNKECETIDYSLSGIGIGDELTISIEMVGKYIFLSKKDLLESL